MGTNPTTTPPAEPYRPRATVQGDTLPVRYKESAASDAQLAKAARTEVLRDVYFPDGQS